MPLSVMDLLGCINIYLCSKQFNQLSKQACVVSLSLSVFGYRVALPRLAPWSYALAEQTSWKTALPAVVEVVVVPISYKPPKRDGL